MKCFRANRRRGFTAPELVVVLGGFSLAFATVALPSLAGAKAKANRIKCVNNTSQIFKGHLSFAQDNAERMPWQLTPRGRQLHFRQPNIALSLDIQSIWSVLALKRELQTPKILHSPCDPQARAGNEVIQENWHAYQPHGRKLPRNGLSYAIHLGAETTRPTTMCVLTRNFDGDDAPIYQPRGMGINPTRVPNGRSLRAGSPNAHFIGADRASHSRVMSGLNHAEGQLSTMDGAARQISENQGRWGNLPMILKAHKNSVGGLTIGNAYEGLTRPRQ